jgi:hypothetical protein
MAITQSDINDFVTIWRQELTYYGDRLAHRSQWGHETLYWKEIKLMLLEAFTDIMEKYLVEWDDPDNNMFTLSEFDDIQQHANRICNSHHWLDLS